jgi:hypothetical protein
MFRKQMRKRIADEDSASGGYCKTRSQITVTTKGLLPTRVSHPSFGPEKGQADIRRHNHDAATLNYMALDHLAGCLEANDCLEGQEKVIIITSHHFCTSVISWYRGTMLTFPAQARVGMMAGEEIW